MSEPAQVGFNSWRAFLWPVHKRELKKFLPMLLIFFLISFDYNILRVLKDSLVVTAKASGAEVIPFIKVWLMFPGALLMTFLFTRFSNRFSREWVFYTMLSLFLVYFVGFLFFAYPHREALHLHGFADSLQQALPAGSKGFIAMIRYWSFTSFYVMSELWSNIILSLVFWGFTNHVTRLNEATRFYGLLGIGANLSGIVAGQVSVWCLSHRFDPSLPYGEEKFDQSLFLLTGCIVVAAVLAMVVYRWMHKNVLDEDQLVPSEKEKKSNMSMRENIASLFQSKYLFCVALIVVAYNLIINLVEVLWKHEVRALYPDPSDYSLYMNQVMILIGVIATLTSLFITGNAVRKCGWTFTAMLTPLILFVTSIGFFGFFFLKDTGDILQFASYGFSPLGLAVLFGTIQNCMSRGAKYTVFDATREMALVPLDPGLKIKGKAAIDGVCSRLGKSGGSVIHQGLLLSFGSLTASAPYVAVFLFAAILIWMRAVRSLGKQFNALTQDEVARPTEAEINTSPDVVFHEQRAV